MPFYGGFISYMMYSEIKGKSIYELQKLCGQMITTDIKNRHLKKQEVAALAGVSAMTLYRLLNGENVSLDVLFRVLRAVKRDDLILNLVTPAPVRPMDLYYKFQNKRKEKNVLAEKDDSLDEIIALSEEKI